MTTRIIIFMLAGFLMASCTTKNEYVSTAEKEKEYLYIYPDGTMEFKGRIKNEEDVIIYKDGRGGERAAIKIIVPRHPDIYRDTIIVERIDVDVQVLREE